jgi:four helix bundle protein
MNDHVFNRFYFQKLDVWKVTRSVVRLTHEVAERVPHKCGELAQQMRTCSQSIAANLAEGMGKAGKERRRFNCIALGSAYELAGHLDIAYDVRAISDGSYEELGALVQRVVMMLAKMTR